MVEFLCTIILFSCVFASFPHYIGKALEVRSLQKYGLVSFRLTSLEFCLLPLAGIWHHMGL